LVLLAVSPATINRIARGLTQPELSEDRNDYIAIHLLRYIHGLTGSAVTFAAICLLIHGIVKIVLVVALLRNKMWAYPWLIVILLAFIGYQLYRITLKPTAGLIALTIFDALITWLTWREGRKQLKHRAARPADPDALITNEQTDVDAGSTGSTGQSVPGSTEETIAGLDPRGSVPGRPCRSGLQRHRLRVRGSGRGGDG